MNGNAGAHVSCLMETFLHGNSRGVFPWSCGAVALALLVSFPSEGAAQTPFWFKGGTNGNLGTAGNWAIDSGGTTNGTTPGALDTAIFSVTAGNSAPTNRLSMGSANRSYGSVVLSNSGYNYIMRTGDGGATNSATNNLTLIFGITNASGAGNFQLGDTDRKATLKLGATNSDFLVANNSASSMIFQQQAGLAGGFTGTRTMVVSGGGQGSTVFEQGIENGGGTGATLVLRVAGTGAVQLGSSTYTGGTTLDSGTIAMASGTAIGTGGLTINGGAIGSVAAERAIANNITVNGNFGLGVTNSGFSGQSTTFNGSMDLGSSTRTITMLANSATFNGAVVGAGGLIVESSSGSRVLTLGGSNTYGGSTTINGGIFRVNGSLSSSTVTVNSGATLGGSGTISGNTTINPGATLAPGNSPGLLSFGGDLTLSGDTFMELAGAGVRGADYDAVNVGGLLTYGGTLTFFLSGSYSPGATFDLFDFSSATGDFSGITLTGSYSGSLANNLGTWTGTVGGASWQFSQGDGVLQVVPEPSTLALGLFGGAAAMMFFFISRGGARRAGGRRK